MFKHISAITVASLLSATAAFAQAETQTAPAPSDPPAATAPAPSTTAPDSSTGMTSPSTDSATSTTTVDTTAANTAPMMTDEEAKNWVNKTVYSSDGKNLGEVAAIERDASGHVRELHADIGGFLGLGETRVKVLPNQFKLSSDRVILDVAGDEAKNLPHLAK